MANHNETSRRDVLKQAGLAAVALTAGGTASAGGAQSAAGNGKRRRVLRVAHLTDIHIKPENRAAEGLAACLRHVQTHHAPDLILNSGDIIWDAMACDASRVRSLWDLSQKTWHDECDVPVEACLGNHDIWGVDKEKSKTTGSEPLYGKKWVMDVYGWDKPYRSFDRAGWHFVALDSVTPLDKTYLGKLDDEQFEWLGEDLARVGPQTPVLVFSHIPIVSAAFFFTGKPREDNNWSVSGSLMMLDALRLKNLFHERGNVKVCLSGHLHIADRVDYLGTSYLCNGAVSGGWWRGNHHEFAPGYGIVDLYDDGTFDNCYVTYGWEAKKA